MKYYVTYKIEARYVTEVEANDANEAKAKAESEYLNANFGVASDLEGELITVEDENGNYLYEA